MGRVPILVIADDLSGAAELAGIAFSRGLSAEVQRQFDPTSPADVIAVDTNTRSLCASDAANRVEEIVRQSLPLRPLYFKKVDSVLRGNPRAEIEAMLKATGLPSALLIPANPSRGRVIQQGQYLIDNVPLDQTPMAHDVEHPRQTADVRTLLGNGQLPLHLVENVGSLPPDGIVVPDVTTDAELEAHVTFDCSNRLLAGAADCFAALLPNRKPVQATPAVNVPALLVCGSRTSWTLRRQECIAGEVPVATIDDPPVESAQSNAYLLGIGESVSGLPQSELLLALAEAAASFMEATPVNTLLIEGGATAAAVAERLGWKRFEVVATAPAGVGVLRPIAVSSQLVLIKPGSYAWPLEIWRSFCGSVTGS